MPDRAGSVHRIIRCHVVIMQTTSLVHPVSWAGHVGLVLTVLAASASAPPCSLPGGMFLVRRSDGGKVRGWEVGWLRHWSTPFHALKHGWRKQESFFLAGKVA